MEPLENQPQPPRVSIIKVNLLVFAGYSIFAILLNFFTGSSGSVIRGPSPIGLNLLVGSFGVHVGILLIISLVELIYGLSKKIKTRSGEYFLASILLLLLGPVVIFVSCISLL